MSAECTKPAHAGLNQYLPIMVTLYEPYRGYTNGTLTGNKDGLRHEIRLSSGLTIFLYEDEFQVD